MLGPPRPQGKGPALTAPTRRGPPGGVRDHRPAAVAAAGGGVERQPAVEAPDRACRARRSSFPAGSRAPCRRARSQTRAGKIRSLVAFSRRATLKPQALLVPKPPVRTIRPGRVAAFASARVGSSIGSALGSSRQRQHGEVALDLAAVVRRVDRDAGHLDPREAACVGVIEALPAKTESCLCLPPFAQWAAVSTLVGAISEPAADQLPLLLERDRELPAGRVRLAAADDPGRRRGVRDSHPAPATRSGDAEHRGGARRPPSTTPVHFALSVLQRARSARA